MYHECIMMAFPLWFVIMQKAKCGHRYVYSGGCFRTNNVFHVMSALLHKRTQPQAARPDLSSHL